MVAVLKPENPSIATTSMPSRHACGRAASHVLNVALERPSTISNKRAGPVRSRTGVRSMITVTNRSPWRARRHTCSSTPSTATPSKRPGSLIKTRRPSSSTAVFAQFHDTSSASATRATVKCWPTIPESAHASPPREIFARGSAAAARSSRHIYPVARQFVRAGPDVPVDVRLGEVGIDPRQPVGQRPDQSR